MIKKIAIIFALALVAFGINAQLPVGGWTVHSPFGGVSLIAETKGMTYYLSAGSLFSIDKATGEVRSLNISNSLNGGKIQSIYAHPEGKYLIVAYQDCNLDRLNDDGSVCNISDISDALITGNPAINHIGFGKNRFYVATSFGLVTFDEKKNETVETMFSPQPVEKVFPMGENVVIAYEKKFMTAPASEHLVNIDKFKLVGGQTRTWTFGEPSFVLSDNRIIFALKSGNNLMPIVADFDFVNDKFVATGVRVNNKDLVAKHFVTLGQGKVMVSDEINTYTFDAECPILSPQVSTFPAVLKGHTLSAFEGLNKLWAGNTDGICQFNIADPANPIQLGEKFGKTDFSAADCNAIATQKSGNILFWNKNNEANLILKFNNTSAFSPTQYSREKRFSNIAPIQVQDNNGNWFSPLKNQMWMIEDPIDPDAYFVGTWSYGLYRIKNGQQTHHLNSTNSPILNENGSRMAFFAIDDQNNIWMGQEAASSRKHNVHCINAAAFQNEEIPLNAWTTVSAPFVCRVSEGIFLSHSNAIVSTQAYWNKNIYFIPTNLGANLHDDNVKLINTYIDQDNKTLSFSHIICFCEDRKGRLWVGTDKGIFEITDPTKITTDVVEVNHLKVPRNDGTGLADYLLDGIQVNSIALDPSNRKWAATATDGVYLISENGDQIIEHYNIDNSILPSNKVYAVACDPNSSSVFFATDAGVVEYNSTAAPASENLDDVYAFPNPVRPEYSGWITVTGLMDNTLVKIADAAGNVFFQGRSEGGMVTWDGCNANGDRVKTGVYYVFASNGTGSDSSSDNCVTKIMVIN